MGKKIFIAFLILAFFNLIGCYSSREVTKDEFLGTKGHKVYLFAENLEKYSFEAGQYDVKNDTLNGTGKKENPGHSAAAFKGSLSLDKVNHYQVEDYNGSKTLGFVVVVVAVPVLIFYLYILRGIDVGG